MQRYIFGYDILSYIRQNHSIESLGNGSSEMAFDPLHILAIMFNRRYDIKKFYFIIYDFKTVEVICFRLTFIMMRQMNNANLFLYIVQYLNHLQQLQYKYNCLIIEP
ncbi:hypothetical protein BpHYR1_019743 [Brachionus plicatilis]|uniref:Uncharacterized protein n=1 Tax=Brachionus plicatilis TaxID=10195 RepID=A0A3M7RB70_BRAPC|nr:hypothetical protein BpHYR1_019743 [Brachionus plicatilis]